MQKNKYEVGFNDEFIGVYYADSELEAIKLCKSEMFQAKFEPDTPKKERHDFGMIANLVEY